MPILPAEPDFYPADLWNLDDGERGSKSRWWCLHTRPRQEKAAARHLRSRQIGYYLPQVIHESRTPAGRQIRSIIPLFPSYLFLLGDEYQKTEALRGNHLANVLEVVDQAAMLYDLRQIQHVLSSGLPIVPDRTYAAGTRIRIVTGPLQGLVGTVVRRQGHRDRFVAIVRLLGRGAAVELLDWQVEPIEEHGLERITTSRASGVMAYQPDASLSDNAPFFP